jgi:acetyltransferase-like isoleucine patch superfamily enzyme
MPVLKNVVITSRNPLFALGMTMTLFASVCHLFRRISRRLRMYVFRPLFASHGCNFHFDPDGFYSYENIHVGDNVNLGYKPILIAGNSQIHIGNKVMFGPQVMLVGGTHNATVVGSFMIDVREKTPNDDLGVKIEDDVWVGARSIILRGVNLARGTIVGAGSLVNRSTPPYAIVGGTPARVLRFRWDVDTILEHEAALYPQEQRLQREDLERWQQTGSMLPPLRRP